MGGKNALQSRQKMIESHLRGRCSTATMSFPRSFTKAPSARKATELLLRLLHRFQKEAYFVNKA
jgi:hypothetical protein